MLKTIQEQYLKIINNSEKNAGNIQIIGLEFVENITTLIENMDTFDLSLMYEIYDQLKRPIEFLNNYERNIFASIKKGIKNALNELLNLQNELIGNELYTLEFVANGLLASPVLQKGVSPDERFKIKNTIINILDEIDN